MGWKNQPATKVSYREQSYIRRTRTASGRLRKTKKNHEKGGEAQGWGEWEHLFVTVSGQINCLGEMKSCPEGVPRQL